MQWGQVQPGLRSDETVDGAYRKPWRIGNILSSSTEAVHEENGLRQGQGWSKWEFEKMGKDS